MSSISPAGVQAALAEFIDSRVLSAIGSDNSSMKWVIGGASALFLSRFNTMYEQYKPALTSFGIINESGNLEMQEAIKFIESAFEIQSEVKMPILGMSFTFDKSDGEAFIAALKSKGV